MKGEGWRRDKGTGDKEHAPHELILDRRPGSKAIIPLTY